LEAFHSSNPNFRRPPELPHEILEGGGLGRGEEGAGRLRDEFGVREDEGVCRF